MDIQSITYQVIKSGKLSMSRKALMRVLLWKEQQGLCHYCSGVTRLFVDTYSGDMATIEHICPKSRGGPNHIRNFVMSCHDCNNQRSSTPYEEFCRARGLDMTTGKRRIALKRERVFRRKQIKKLIREDRHAIER